MRLSRRKLKFMQKLALIGAALLILFILGYYTGYLRENCGRDATCFAENVEKCGASSFIDVKNNNIYQYVIWPGFLDQCHVRVTLERVSVGAPPEYLELEGKEMMCTISKDDLEATSLDNFDNFMDYCTGPLKEELYELIIKRMYENVVSQLGPILISAGDVLGES